MNVIEMQLSVERFYCSQVLKAILHSILFHRTFSNTRPVEESISQLNNTCWYCKANGLDTVVEDHIASCLATIDQNPQPSRTYLLTVQFFEKQKSWFNKQCWEEWKLKLIVTRAKSEKEQIMARNDLQEQVKGALQFISLQACQDMSKLPKIVDTEPFPFSVSITRLDSWPFTPSMNIF